ncbi:MAG TPA: DNA polymerase [Phycisphaerales bacterium]|nr:DNA polymerase [Phycisphaerales bacterium]
MPGVSPTVAASDADRLRRVARQHAQTTRLLGVDFLPLPARKPVLAPEPADPDPGAGDRAALLAALRARHDAQCPHCTRAKGYTQTVFGDGSPAARLMFIGEAPGAEEDRTGVPFVGRAGQKLNEMIGAMGLTREEVYIANVLKARPPENATPTPEEASRCGPYLLEQVRIIQPKVIVTLGKPAANFLLRNSEAMGALRGHWHDFEGIPVMPTFHPAYLLRAYTPENRKKVWSDLQQAMSRLSASQ